MAIKRMLIDASHPEETRVLVVNGNRLEDFDVEVESRRPLKGNIYLAKVTRVEPSLQAAFVDFGGNRHGFLAFNEIHPDYYQIPVADREALLAEEREAIEKAVKEETVAAEHAAVEVLGGDDSEELEVRRPKPEQRRYKIQEVIKRRQILLVQVVKEERGTKGAALTTYLSLAGRYCVLMPNTARGGGISRKIQSQADRKRLKAITAELDIQDGMGVIVRTAGMERSKPEIKRDFEYLLRTWDSIRERTLESSAPALIYEEAGLIKRSIRDLYSDQIDEVIVEGEEGYRFAHDFMQMLMPNHADNVKQYQDKIPLFTRYQVEQQLDAMFSPTVQLRSGGYIVINPTEALVSIDVNSGKSTREHNIEETAYKTNLEAAEEVARQLRLRDLAGLIVIDFIDMEENRNIRKVEQKLKECLRNDRARIQVGRISGFGLLEMSRQRLRPSLIESSTMPCPHCQGRGYVRSIESTALTVLRAIEEEGIRDRSAEITVSASAEVALYLLNHKRDRIGDMERRYVMRIILAADSSLVPPDFRIERSKTRQPGEVNRPEAPVKLDPMRPITQESAYASEADEGDADEAEAESGVTEAGAAGEETAEGDGRRRRRRRRRRGGRNGREDGREEGVSAEGAESAEGDSETEAGEDTGDDAAEDEGVEPADGQPDSRGAEGAETQGEGQDGEGRRRRRGRRGGRRRRGRDGEAAEGGERQPRPPREDRPRRDDSFVAQTAMTPASIGAMLDGVPEFDFGDDLPPLKPAVSSSAKAPEKALEHEPAALAPVEAAPLTAPPPVEPTVVAPVAPPAMPAPTPEPVSTGPVFETTVIAPDGKADKPADAPAPKKGWWRR